LIYLDTSALVALFVNEPHSAAVARWYSRTKSELVSAVWCVPEFASALGIKQRTGQLDEKQAAGAWERFGRLAANDLRLLPLAPAQFHRAAMLALDASTALRAGDALHLACAEQAGTKTIATLDDVLGRAAQRMKIKPVLFA
jgi:predicted nucleic acid-binding protein